jgi:hypothetical protein
MNDKDLSSALGQAATHLILCRFSAVKRTSYGGLNVFCDAVSNESDIVIENEEIFRKYGSLNFRDTYCLLGEKFQYLDSQFPFLSIDEKEKLLQDKLQDKLIPVRPYYNCKDPNSDLFYKNASPAGEENYDLPKSQDDKFLTIPKITSEDEALLLQKKPFVLSNWDKDVFGIPKYLFAGNKLFLVDLVTAPNNSMIYSQKPESEIIVFDVNYSSSESNGDLIQPHQEGMEESYVFFSALALTKLPKENADAGKEKAVPESPLAVAPAKVAEETIKYEISDTAKVLTGFNDYLKAFNLIYDLQDIYNFHTCLRSAELTILAGMSGTGKTRLPLKYAEYFNMSEEKKTLLFIPVSPSFTEPSDILGFYNPSEEMYVPSETGLTQFLIHAAQNPDKMHMVIFDEMNLSPIEYYFAPFLSVLEKDPKDRYLSLYSSHIPCKNGKEFPERICIGTNILFVGTINLDETTKNLSDRLLDRSFVVNLKRASFTSLQVQQRGQEEQKVPPTFHADLSSLMGRRDYSNFRYISKFSLPQLTFLEDVDKALNQIDSQKGISYRCVKNIAIYLENKPDEFDDKAAFDYAFKQTLMKKINGSSESLGEFLGDIASDGSLSGQLVSLFDAHKDVSDFTECRQEVKNKILEYKKNGYVR